MHRSLLIIIILMLFLLEVWNEQHNAIDLKSHTYAVIRIHDGDTVSIKRANERLKIRIFGIDAPELQQPLGLQAKKQLQRILLDQQITLKIVARDRYKRTVARVFLKDGTDLGVFLTKQGLARWHRKFAPDDQELARAEQQARAAQLGVWSK